MNEDICDSMVAYIYDPNLLKTISPDKFAILEAHDAKQEKPAVTVNRVAKDQLALPEVKPETIKYHIKEPAAV